MAALLALSGVSKTYSGSRVLFDVDLTVNAGEVHAIVGENGAGKSTLIKIISGVETADPGAQLNYFGEDMIHVTAQQTISMGLAVIYQDLSLFPNLSVAENIMFGANRASGRQLIRWKNVERAAQAVLDDLGITLDTDELVENLSLGEQQMLAIARAVASEARVIIMDEPTSALSISEVTTLYALIRRLTARGVGIVFISHKFDEIFEIVDRVTVLRDGKHVGHGEIGEFTEDALIALMVGRELALPDKNEHFTTDQAVLEVNGLGLDGVFADITFTLREGEVLAITGLMGAGRTELAHALFGLTPPTTGTTSMRGETFRATSPAAAIAHGIGYVPEDRRSQGMFAGHSITENITVTNFRAVLNRLRMLSPRRERAVAHRYITELDVRPQRESADAGTLSGGNQQKVLLSRWLNSTPQVLIVDEPTNGIDVGAKREIHRLLRRLAASGMGVIVISSELPEVLAVSDRILVMRHGRMVADLVTATATQESILELELQG